MKMSKLRKYILPHLVYSSFSKAVEELNYFRKYKKILSGFEEDGTLKQMGIRLEDDGTMFFGVNLNPELLVYEMDSQEPVEMRFLTDAIKKYTDFFSKMSVLDYMIADYQRVKNEEYYGYVVALSFNFKNYTKTKLIYDISYMALGSVGIVSLILSLIL